MPSWSPMQPTQASGPTLVGSSPVPGPSYSQSRSGPSRNVDRPPQAGPSQPTSRRVSKNVPKAPTGPLLQPAQTSGPVRLDRQSDADKVPKRATAEANLAKRKKPDSSNDNPPYRNTRSRSRSVEPLASLTNTKSRARKNAKATAGNTAPSMPEILEVSDDEGGASMPAGETMKEEQDVMEHLFDVEHSMTMNDEPNENVVPSGVGAGKNYRKHGGQRKPSSGLDSDDQQIHDALNRASRPADKEADVFGPKVAPGGPRLQPGNVGVQPETTQRTAPTRSARRGRGGALQLGRHPVNSPHRQKARQASPEATFPSPGTRAYRMRNHLENQEKSTAYVPPAGTRAAALKR